MLLEVGMVNSLAAETSTRGGGTLPGFSSCGPLVGLCL